MARISLIHNTSIILTHGTDYTYVQYVSTKVHEKLTERRLIHRAKSSSTRTKWRGFRGRNLCFKTNSNAYKKPTRSNTLNDKIIGIVNDSGVATVRTISVGASLEFSSTSPNESMLYGQTVMLYRVDGLRLWNVAWFVSKRSILQDDSDEYRQSNAL